MTKLIEEGTLADIALESGAEPDKRYTLRQLTIGLVASGVAISLAGVLTVWAGYEKIRSLASPVTQESPVPTNELGVQVFPEAEETTTSMAPRVVETTISSTSTTSTTLTLQPRATQPEIVILPIPLGQPRQTLPPVSR